MGIETAIAVAAIGSAVAAGTQVYGGIQQRNAAKHQAGLERDEAQVKAQQERDAASTAAQQQKMAFIKSGLGGLAGSPLLLIQNTYDKGEYNANQRIKTGYAQAESYEKQGQAAYVQGLGSGFQTASHAILSGYDMMGGAGGGGTLNTGWYSTQGQADAVSAKNGIVWN